MATRKQRLLRAAAFGGAFVVMTLGATATASASCKSSEITVTDKKGSYDRMDRQLFLIAQSLGSPFGLDHFAGVSESVDKNVNFVICVDPRNNVSPSGYTINVKDDHKN